MTPRTPPKSRARSGDALRVSDLARLIDSALREGVPGTVRVVGEVSGFRERTHWYFDLKDEAAVVSCVMFASAAAKSRVAIIDGLEVVASGRVEFYAKSGRTSFLVSSLAPVGAGALDLAFRRLCEELRGLGYFDEAHKRPVPTLARRIAVVTSRTGAALQDVLETARKRWAGVEILLLDVRVQGETAAPEIARAVRWVDANAQRLGIDALLLTRGGGSMEDLWAFNERVVADAIHDARVPIVAAIGHESDTTISELVADLRCSTPTQAAVRLVPDAAALREQPDRQAATLTTAWRREFLRRNELVERCAANPVVRDPGVLIARVRGAFETATHRLTRSTGARLLLASSRLDRLAARLELHRPVRSLSSAAVRLHDVERRLGAAVRSAVDRRPALERLRERLERVQDRHRRRLADLLGSRERELEAISPVRVLERGYSWTTLADGSLLRSTGQARRGDWLTTRLADGAVRSRVEPEGSADTPKPTGPGGKGGKGRGGGSMDLFDGVG